MGIIHPSFLPSFLPPSLPFSFLSIEIYGLSKLKSEKIKTIDHHLLNKLRFLFLG
jgi:hypothetical protein